MTKRHFLTDKQKQRLICNSKIRKQTKQWILSMLNEGRTYGRGTTFFHPTKGQIQDARQPTRYKAIQGPRRV